MRGGSDETLLWKRWYGRNFEVRLDVCEGNHHQFPTTVALHDDASFFKPGGQAAAQTADILRCRRW